MQNLQIMQITGRVVLCLNLMDEARAHGIDVDVRGLARDLGIPAVGTSARRGEGLDELLAAIRDVATGVFVREAAPPEITPEALRGPVGELADQLRAAYPLMENPAWVALRLLEGDGRVIAGLEQGEFDGPAMETKEVNG
jgi:ferrous iron transport protein B